MKYSVGSLVSARGREWVVLPESKDQEDMLILRPLGGTEDEVTGICTLLEEVTAAKFSPPNPAKELGNHLSCMLLRDAVRLGFRSGAGPFRSLGRIAVEPRPYQLVPLLMALKLDPVRLLIADDVGIGKTIEACLIARELLDRGEIQRLAVLCPPHLAEQWQRALRDQFHIEAELVLAGTAAKLERDLALDQTIFAKHPFTIVSTDFIKRERRRLEFMRECPEFVIVDEAHTCASGLGRGASQQRHELLKSLVADRSRHLVLVTATPHSGKEETFRSLLALLDPRFLELPEDLSGDQNRGHREELAKHLVQRRRGADLKSYLGVNTPFPEREIAEHNYTLDKEYHDFFHEILAYCRESVTEEGLDKRRQRIRWWSALALLRSLASSPRAAASTLRNRSSAADALTEDQVDDEGRRAVLDIDDETAEGIDVAPGSQTEEPDTKTNKRLLALARKAEKLEGAKDRKLKEVEALLGSLIKDGYHPILFCRFIPTVNYLVEQLRTRLKGVTVVGVTGNDPPPARAEAIAELGHAERRVLVCTDCLSEGIDLQHGFSAVVHYDLSWNPTRHEQREGRVDRYGGFEKVRTLTFYGKDNPIDGIVLNVLLRKHRAIHQQLGIVVPVPMDTNAVVEAVFEGLLLRDTENREHEQKLFPFAQSKRDEVEFQWNAAAEREKRSRTIFAQRSIKPEEVAEEIAESQRALGGIADVEQFTLRAFEMLGAKVVPPRRDRAPTRISLSEADAAVRDAIEEPQLEVVFGGTGSEGATVLTRTHPVVERLAAHVLETALDPELEGPGRRCGVIRTAEVGKRTTILLLRLRFHIVSKGRDGEEHPLLAEDQVLVGFEGSPEKAQWLPIEKISPLLAAPPRENMAPELAREALNRVLERLDTLRDPLAQFAQDRGKALLDAHRRVRKAAKAGVQALKVELAGEPDLLGVYVYLPATGGAA